MDTNDKIVGIVFEIDKTVYNKKIREGNSSDKASRLAAKSIMVFNSDNKKHEYIELGNYSENAKEAKINECLKKASQAEISSYYSGDPRIIDSIDRVKNDKNYLSTAERDETTKKIAMGAKKNGVKITVAALTVATVAALGACGARSKDAPQDENAVETTMETQLEIEDWEQYLAAIPDSNEQKQLFTNSADWLTSINAQEDWMKVTLTEDEMNELNYTSPDCLYGFTAEEAYSLALRFNSYTNNQYVTLTGGERMDTVAIMNDAQSASNGALKNIQAYYINSDKCDLNIEKILTFTENGKNKIDELEELFNQYKELDKEENKEKEAKEKMAEIKSVILECAYDTTFDANAKSYILRTFLPAANTISQIHQYKDTLEIEVYDTKKGTNVTKEIKTDLFDEITMRALSLGFATTSNVDGFDSEQFLENHDLSSDRYNLLYNDVATSIADQSCSAQMTKLEEANTYIDSVKNTDVTAELAFAGGQGMDLTNVDYKTLNNVPTDYDTLTADTLNSTNIIEFLNNYLKEKEIYPQNIEYFSTKMIELKSIAYKDTHGVTQGQKGDTIKTETQTQVPVTESQLNAPNSIVLNHAGEQVTAEEAMEEARKENVEQTGIADASTPEASEKADQEAQQSAAEYAAMLQNVYDTTYNYFYYGNASGYDASWATSSNADIVARHNRAQSQALDRKAQEEAAAKENEAQQNQTPTIDPEFVGAEIYDEPQAPVPSVDNTTPETPNTTQSENNQTETKVENNQTEVQPEINYFPGFEDVEIEGDIIIGETTTTTEVTPTNSEGFSTEAPAGLSSVVDANTVTETTTSSNFLTVEQIDSIIANMSDEEWAAFEANGQLIETENNSEEQVKTR